MKNKKMKNKLFYSKIAKGLTSFVTILILLSSILATSIIYNNNITANVVKENSFDKTASSFLIEEFSEDK